MKSAIVGCGNISRKHFAAIKDTEGAEIIAVCDIKQDRAEAKAAECGAKVYCDYDEMLKNEQPDIIHIVTPHYLHTPMAIKALEHGANVFIEKPCAVTPEEADMLIEAQEKSGRQVGVCFQNRYNDSSITAKKIIESGKYGKVKSVRAFLNWSRGKEYYSDDWHGTLSKECGGVLINQTIHTIDLIQYLCGECSKLTAHTFNDHLKGIVEVEDTATVLMKLGDGVTGILYATLAYAENADVMIEIALEEAKLRIEGEMLYLLGKDGKAETLCEKSGAEFCGQSYWGHGHSAIIKDFYDCVSTGRKFLPDAIEGSKAVRIVSACYKSSKENTQVEVK